MNSPELPPPIDYRKAAGNLRGSLRRNRWDSIFSLKANTKIHYIFDTNVFLFHANLEDQKHQREDLSVLLGAEIDDPFLVAMERLTTDYMFSGHLPAQDHEPVYLSTPHFEEVVEKTVHIEKTLSGRISNVPPAVTARIRELLSMGGSGSRDHLVELQKLIPTAWQASLRAHVHLKDVLENSFLADPPHVMPLHHVPWGWDAGRPMRSEIELWRRDLNDEAMNRDRNRDNDAKTIATIIDLYRNDASSRFQNRKTLYLFITHDAAIARVVGDRIADLRAEGIPYFVRSPRDFMPLLNLQSMGSVYGPSRDNRSREELKKIFQKLTVALDWIEFDPSREYGSVDRNGLLPTPLLDLHNAWRELSEASTFLNAKYFERSNNDLFRGLSSFVSETYEATVQSLKTTIEDVRTTHVTAVLDNALAAAADARAHGEQTNGRRAQLKLIGPRLFVDLLEPRDSIGEFLDRTIERGTLSHDVEERIAKDPGRSQVAMLVACLFLSAEDWTAAADFAAQAVGKLEDRASPAAATEAAYLRALCLRFSMRSERDFLKARHQLDRNLALYRNSPQSLDNYWRSIRDRLERATLYLSASVMQAIAERNRMEDPKTAPKTNYVPAGHEMEYFSSGVFDSEHCLQALHEDLSEHSHAKSRYGELYTSLEVQALTNIAGAWIYSTAIRTLRDSPKMSRDDTLSMLRTIIDEAGKEGRPLRDSQPIYALLLEALDSPIEIGIVLSAKARERIRALMDANHRRPSNDKLRFEFLANWLENEKWTPAT